MATKKRFFREHRGGFAESMDTMREVGGLEDIIALVESDDLVRGYYKNIRIAPETKRPHRQPHDEWGEDTYMVVADFDGYTGQCIGYANFYEDGTEPRQESDVSRVIREIREITRNLTPEQFEEVRKNVGLTI